MKYKGNTRKTKKKALIAGVALAAIMIGGTLSPLLPFGSNNSNSSNSSRNEQNPNEIIRKLYNPVIQNASALGSTTADITMIEFSGYQCQSCVKFHRETMDEILRNFVNTGQVRYLFKDFLINNESPPATTTATPNIVDKGSRLAAEASYCAAEQGKYWQYHNELYQNAENENTEWITEDNLKRFSSNVGIGDPGQFSNCLASHKYSKVVNENDNLAKNIGLQSIPTFILLSNRTQPLAIQGVQPYSTFEKVFTEMQSSNTFSSSER
jgi:protein-disulfide isomerase